MCVQYFWSSDGPVGDLSQKSHKKLQLERGILRGGRTYNFSVVVLSSQVWNTASKKSVQTIGKSPSRQT